MRRDCLKPAANQLDIRVGSRWYKSGLGRGLLGPVTLQIGSRAIATGAGPLSSQNIRPRFTFNVRSNGGGIRIVFSRPDDYHISINDVLGRTLNEYDANKASLFEVPKNACPPSVCIISIRSGGEVRQTKCVMVK